MDAARDEKFYTFECMECGFTRERRVRRVER
jgi:ribosomal protein L37E